MTSIARTLLLALSVAMSGSVGVLAAETDRAAIGATARSTLAQLETGDTRGISSMAWDDERPGLSIPEHYEQR
jgi:hypothetical protein